MKVIGNGSTAMFVLGVIVGIIGLQMCIRDRKYDCAFVDNEMPYGRVPQGHPVIVDYFYHEEIRGTENTGKRNR